MGKAAAFCPCKPNVKKMRGLFDAQKKRRKKMGAKEPSLEEKKGEGKRGGGIGAQTLNILFLLFVRKL